MKQLVIAFIALLTWSASTLFTDGVEEVVDNFFVNKYHHRAVVYFISALFLVSILVYLNLKFPNSY